MGKGVYSCHGERAAMDARMIQAEIGPRIEHPRARSRRAPWPACPPQA